MEWRIPNPSGKDLFFKINSYGPEHPVLRKRFGTASCMLLVMLNGRFTTFFTKINRVNYTEAPLNDFIEQLVDLKFKITKNNITYLKTKRNETYTILDFKDKNYTLKAILYCE